MMIDVVAHAGDPDFENSRNFAEDNGADKGNKMNSSSRNHSAKGIGNGYGNGKVIFNKSKQDQEPRLTVHNRASRSTKENEAARHGGLYDFKSKFRNE